jgi:hypothetical protein
VDKIFSATLQQNVNIDPVKLRNTALAFKVSDGLLPSSKIISGDALNVGFQTLAAVPTLSQGYNLPPMFSYLMKTQNADIASFEKGAPQQAYEQALAQWNNLATLAVEKGIDPATKLPPQPTPDQFGYDPNQQLQRPGVIPGNQAPTTTPAAQLPNQSSQVIQKGSTNYPTQS